MNPILLGIILPEEAVKSTANIGIIGTAITISTAVLVAAVTIYLINKYEKKRATLQFNYKDDLEKSIKSLKSSYSDIESTIFDIETNATKKEEELRILERNIKKLINEENNRRNTIEELKEIPLPAADQFISLLREERKRSGRSPIKIAGFLISCVVSALIGYSINFILNSYLGI